GITATASLGSGFFSSTVFSSGLDPLEPGLDDPLEPGSDDPLEPGSSTTRGSMTWVSAPARGVSPGIRFSSPPLKIKKHTTIMITAEPPPMIKNHFLLSFSSPPPFFFLAVFFDPAPAALRSANELFFTDKSWAGFAAFWGTGLGLGASCFNAGFACGFDGALAAAPWADISTAPPHFLHFAFAPLKVGGILNLLPQSAQTPILSAMICS
ncbi:MAG: hypothetical protein ABIK28_13050, partial [Planctomycetota bacterium]